MTGFAKAIALVAAFSASAALAQADPHAGHHPDNGTAQAAPAKPDATPQAEGEGCRMMKGMMRGQPGGQKDDPARGKDGGPAAAGGMRCMSPPQSAANDDHPHDHPGAKTK